jgi:hypothetical protein
MYTRSWKKGGNRIQVSGESWDIDDPYPYLPVMLTVLAPPTEVQLVEIGSCKVALLKAKVPRNKGEGLYYSQRLFPFLNGEDHDSNPVLAKYWDDEFMYPTFAGYNVTENDVGQLICQVVPAAFNLLEDVFEEMLWDFGETKSFLPLDCLWMEKVPRTAGARGSCHCGWYRPEGLAQ